jgi:predicted porin
MRIDVMKNVSKLALFVAAGMVSAGVNAASIEIADATSMTLEGGFESIYVTQDTVKADKTKKADLDDLSGEATLGLAAVRSYGQFDAYVEVGFSYNTQTKEESKLSSDGAVAGLTGGFGQVEVGDSDSVYVNAITDTVDITEQAGLEYGAAGIDGQNMLTYYSPEANGFSVNLQAGILDEAENSGDSEQSLIASAAYNFGIGTLKVAFDDRGESANSDDEQLGFSAIFPVGAAEIGFTHETITDGGADTDDTGLAIAVNYGPGDVYGTYHTISPEDGEDKSQYALGINAGIEDGLSVFAELADFDGQKAADKDSLMAIGVLYEF